MKCRRVILLALLILSSCMLQKGGRTESAISRKIENLRNRDIVNAKINPSITLDTILKGCPEDTTRFSSSDYVSITGFLLGVYEETDTFRKFRSKDSIPNNIQLYIGQSVSAWKYSVFVAELTKKYILLHPAFDPDVFIGKKINLTGYMMYNSEAKQLALDADKKSHKSDRKTAWEICPVTSIKLAEIN